MKFDASCRTNHTTFQVEIILPSAASTYREPPARPLFVGPGVVEEECDEGVVDDGHEEEGIEQRVEVRAELQKYSN